MCKETKTPIIFRNRIFLVIVKMIRLLKKILVLPPPAFRVVHINRNTQAVRFHVLREYRIRFHPSVFPYGSHIMDITEQYPILGIPRYVITGHPYIVLIALAIVIDPVYIINPEVYPDIQTSGHILVMNRPEKIQVLPEIINEIKISIWRLCLQERRIFLGIEPRRIRVHPMIETRRLTRIEFKQLIRHPQTASAVPKIPMLIGCIVFLESVQNKNHRIELGKTALHIKIIEILGLSLVPGQTRQFRPADRIAPLCRRQSRKFCRWRCLGVYGSFRHPKRR